MVGVIVCVAEKGTVPDVMTDALGDAVREIVALLCVVDGTREDGVSLLCVLEMTVLIVKDGVAYGGRFKSGVVVGKSVHGLISFAPRTWSAYMGGVMVPLLM